MTVMPDPRLTRDYLAGLFQKMAARRIVVVGDAMLDVYLSGDAERISPEAPVPVVTVRARRTALGGAANVAANVAAIGAECRLVAVIGDDARGDSFRAELVQNRLVDEHIVVAAARLTTSKTRVTARGQQVVRIDEEVEDPISPRAEEQLAARLQRAMGEAEGMALFTKDKQVHRIPAMAREVFDVSGAGDTVTAWVGTALAAGASVREAAQVANYAAGVEVGKSGVATVSPAEVLAAHDTRYDQLGKLRRGGLL